MPASSADGDGTLNLAEFSALIRGREDGEHSEEELKKRFDALDVNGTGQIDMQEYLIWSLKDALARSSQRIVDLFKAWDEDHSVPAPLPRADPSPPRLYPAAAVGTADGSDLR